MAETFSYSGAVQYVTITTTGYYEITAIGGTGGGSAGSEADLYDIYSTLSTAPGGDGAETVGTFYLVSGDVLELAVAGAGGTGTGGPNPNGTYGGSGSGGGGGGSFVILTSGTGDSETYTPLLVAGGGGGAGFAGIGLAGENAQASTYGGNGDDVDEITAGRYPDFHYGDGAPGGTDGSGGGGYSVGGFDGSGGGGYLSDGQGGGRDNPGIGFDNNSPPVQDFPYLSLDGGPPAPGPNGAGGFGGGAGGGDRDSESGGGGGGYSGGGGGVAAGGGGGGSYDAGTDQSITAAYNASGNGEIILDLLCFLAGTRVLTPTGEILVEDLRIGDMVVTRFGAIQPVKWIGRQSYDTRFVAADPGRLPVCIHASALGPRVPARDLYVSPGHSMLVDGKLVLASVLVNGLTITQHWAPARLDYFQIELATHDCVIAEGAWSETFADGPGLRAQFHNASEFEALYPNEAPPEALRLCAPRPERGAGLDAALRPIVARVGAGVTPGPLRGSLDRVEAPFCIEGWARDEAHPDLPVLLEILLDDQVIGTALACDYRADLAEAGLGRGRCAFFVTSPVRLRPEVLDRVRIRRVSDQAGIPMSQDCLDRIAATREPAPGFGQARIANWRETASGRRVGMVG